MTARHCIVTGSASGIGNAVARRLCADGWRVSGVDRNQHPPGIGESFTAHTVDLLDEAATRTLARCLAGEAPTAFVHCAGLMRAGLIGEPRMVEDGELLWRLHVAAAVILGGEIAPHLPERDGRIVLMSSRAVLGRAGRGMYAASKGAVSALVRSWAIELVRRGITVNAVAPGATDTPMLVDPNRGGGKAVSNLPIGRLVRADEVAELITYLIGPHAGAITGQTIMICGGDSLGAGA